jgi:hypothetical protein
MQTIPLDVDEGEPSLTRNFYFIFDGSGSMADNCAGQAKILGAKAAVESFLKKVPTDANLGLLIFDKDGAREVVALEPNNRAQFLKAIKEVKDGGGTPLARSIQLGSDKLVEQYKKQLGYGDYRLIVVTDGQADKIPAAADYAASFGIPIYAIGLCMEGDHPLRSFAISYREASNYQDLERALEETVAETEVYDPTVFE